MFAFGSALSGKSKLESSTEILRATLILRQRYKLWHALVVPCLELADLVVDALFRLYLGIVDPQLLENVDGSVL